MKTMLWIPSLAFSILWQAVADAGDAESSSQAKLEKSEQKWQELKAACGGNYSYKKTFSSWVGFGNETVIVVTSNKVAERRYREESARGAPQPVALGGGAVASEPQEETWVETGTQIGTHPKGAEALTLDMLYQQAKAIASKELRPEESLQLRFDTNGLLNACYTANKLIMDDAPRNGVDISDLRIGLAAPR